MNVPVPPDFEPAPDASPADWVVRRLKPWGKDRVRLWSFLPEGFERYARVLHPAYRRLGDRGTVRWGEMAALNGVTLGPTTSFREVSGLDPSRQRAWNDAEPIEGTLEREQVAALAGLLAPFTRMADRCWVAAWDGWGSWGPGSSATLVATTGRPRRFGRHRRLGRVSRRALDRAVVEQKRMLASVPRVATPHRGYFLFTARLAAVPLFEVGGWHQAPSIWWPDDRAWCVVTEVDGYSTYVGGTATCVAALLGSDDVEAIEVPPDVPMDPGAY